MRGVVHMAAELGDISAAIVTALADGAVRPAGRAQAFPVVPSGIVLNSGATGWSLARTRRRVWPRRTMLLPLRATCSCRWPRWITPFWLPRPRSSSLPVLIVFDNGVLGRQVRVVEDEVAVVAAAYADRQGGYALALLYFAILGEDFDEIRCCHGLRVPVVDGARDSASRKVRVTRMPRWRRTRRARRCGFASSSVSYRVLAASRAKSYRPVNLR